MNNLLLKLVALSGLILMSMSGCSNDGKLSYFASTSPLSVVTGSVADGPIENAQVFIDLNLNGAFDEGEPFDITDEHGYYEINYILDSETTYMLVVIGTAALNTVDPLDNPGTPLNFIMYDEFTSVKYALSTQIVGSKYTKNISPSIFKNYLSALDKTLYNQLDTNNTAVQGLIDSSAGTSEVKLFQDFILNQQTSFEDTLQEILQRTEQTNKVTALAEVKSDLVLAKSDSLSFSDENTSALSQTLYYKDKTTPSKVGNFAVAKNLEPLATASDYDIFVSKYASILEIPEYQELHDANYSIVDGADILVRQDKTIITSNAKLSNEIVSSYSFVNTTNSVDLLQYLNGHWTLKASNISITDIQNMTLDLVPFVVVEKINFATKSYNIKDFDAFTDAVVIVKGTYTGSALADNSIMRGEEVVITYAKPATNGDVNLTLPAGFVVNELVVVSEKLADITPEKKASVALEVQNDVVLQTDSSITPLKYVKDANETELIVGGDLTQSSLGLESMIDTKLLYNNLRISLGLIDDALAKDILLSNINSFMGGNNSFDAKSQTIIDFGSSKLTIDERAKTLLLETTNISNAQTQDSLSVTWSFSKEKIVRVFNHVYSSGDKKGSVYRSTYTFEYKNNDNSIVAQLHETNLAKTTFTDYSDTLSTSYIGTAIFNRNSDDLLTRVISSKFTQTHDATSSLRPRNYLNGLVTTQDINTTTSDVFDNSLAFEGEFLLQSDTYEPIQGSVKIYKEDANTTKGTKNNNKISAATILTKDFEKLPVDLFYTGKYSGSFTNSCSATSGTIYVDLDTLTWQGYDGNMTYYGTKVAIENNVSVLYNYSAIWGTLELNGTVLGGTWSEQACDGNVSLSKQ